MLEGHAGMEGYIAPEVGETKFSPIRADLWSIGKVVEELCMRCRPSPSREKLLVKSYLSSANSSSTMIPASDQ